MSDDSKDDINEKKKYMENEHAKINIHYKNTDWYQKITKNS